MSILFRYYRGTFIKVGPVAVMAPQTPKTQKSVAVSGGQNFSGEASRTAEVVKRGDGWVIVKRVHNGREYYEIRAGSTWDKSRKEVLHDAIKAAKELAEKLNVVVTYTEWSGRSPSLKLLIGTQGIYITIQKILPIHVVKELAEIVE